MKGRSSSSRLCWAAAALLRSCFFPFKPVHAVPASVSVREELSRIPKLNHGSARLRLCSGGLQRAEASTKRAALKIAAWRFTAHRRAAVFFLPIGISVPGPATISGDGQ